MENLVSKIKECYKTNEIKKLHEEINDSFRDYFVGKNYLVQHSAPLISQEDKSVIFTGSSTNVVKPIILSGDYKSKNGFIINQECLRNHFLKYAFNNERLPYGQGYFHISAVLSKPGSFQRVVKEFEEYTTQHIGINPSSIKINSSKKFEELKDIRRDTNLQVEYDTENESYYKWKYGLTGIRGEGITININNNKQDNFLGVGNIIRILDNKDNEKGIEFGYGHEFLSSTILGIKNPLELSEIFGVFPFKPDLSSKYYLFLEIISRIKDSKNKVRRVNRSSRKTYRKYLQSAKYMGKCLGKSPERILSELSTFFNHISPQDDFSLEKKILSR